MKTKLTNTTLQELMAANIIDNCCDANPRFVGRPELAAELAVECLDYIEGELQNNSDLIAHGTARQISAARGWTQQVKAQIYLRLGVEQN